MCGGGEAREPLKRKNLDEGEFSSSCLPPKETYGSPCSSYLSFVFNLQIASFNCCIICSHEIKRCLLLGRKVMTNLDSIFKSRDITLPTKVLLVKAVVFPVVMYGCESWTVKKAER